MAIATYTIVALDITNWTGASSQVLVFNPVVVKLLRITIDAFIDPSLAYPEQAYQQQS